MVDSLYSIESHANVYMDHHHLPFLSKKKHCPFRHKAFSCPPLFFTFLFQFETSLSDNLPFILYCLFDKKGENARLSSFVGAIAVADMVKTTLGPKGMDKILQKVTEHDQGISVTNDGATILRSVMLDNAAAKVLVDIARVQDDEVGDGTTSVAVLCGELLREAEQLVNQRIHPQTIVASWRLTRNTAKKVDCLPRFFIFIAIGLSWYRIFVAT